MKDFFSFCNFEMLEQEDILLSQNTWKKKYSDNCKLMKINFQNKRISLLRSFLLNLISL